MMYIQDIYKESLPSSIYSCIQPYVDVFFDLDFFMCWFMMYLKEKAPISLDVYK